ncbi:hypothetical protein J6TS2_50810 [Heyndrickxia sporothermodurans]|nr:hypothetical protein J6TS2_50810 [Heyndrickxia sporothermodurans]
MVFFSRFHRPSDGVQYQMNKETENKVMNVLYARLTELKDELEKM